MNRLRAVFFLLLTTNAERATIHTRGDDMAILNFRLPDDLREYIEKQAADNRTSMGHYVVMLIDKDMKEKVAETNGANK